MPEVEPVDAGFAPEEDAIARRKVVAGDGDGVSGSVDIISIELPDGTRPGPSFEYFIGPLTS